MTDIFVFGSNLAGRHGKGAARDALLLHGAKYGVGIGLQGNSYAIPTKDWQLRTLPLAGIRIYVDEFKQFAASRPDLRFLITRVGCGLAGYRDDQIAPLFRGIPPNCIIPSEWGRFILV